MVLHLLWVGAKLNETEVNHNTSEIECCRYLSSPIAVSGHRRVQECRGVWPFIMLQQNIGAPYS